MSVRFLRITTNYPEYLAQFYARRPALAAEPYAVQHAALLADAFGWFDVWSVALGKLGYTCGEVIANAEPLQKRWAQEHGRPYDDNHWLLDITRQQIAAFAPDVLFVNEYSVFTAPFLRQVKAECPSIRVVLGWCGAPYRDASVFREYDRVLSNVPELVEDFRAQGLTATHFDHAFEPRILERIHTQAPPAYDFTFIGSIVAQSDYHLARERLLAALVEQTDLQIFTSARAASRGLRWGTRARQAAYEALRAARRWPGVYRRLEALPVTGRVARWEHRPSLGSHVVNPRLARRLHPPLFALAMYQGLHDSRVTLNTHIDLSARAASNMRLFEATGVGTCLLTDWKANLPDLFEPDREIISYRSAEECVDKVRYLLDHEAERAAIAAAGQRRTLCDHTFDNRAVLLDELIRQHLGR